MRALGLFAAISLVLAAAFLAQGQGVDPERIRQMLVRSDANKDGTVEEDEVPEAQRQLFQQMLRFEDANKDGKLQPAEVQKLLVRAKNQANAKGKAAAQAKQGAQMLAQMDKDKDGKVSRAEFTGYDDYFDRLDSDKEGFLVPKEIGGGRQNLLRKDLPHVAPPRSSTGLVPLTDLKTGTYQGKEGGLYPGGGNDRPAAHEDAGLRLARSLVPLDEDGKPSDTGKIVLISIGMSNTTMEFSSFKRIADADPQRNPKLVIVDCAQGGRTARVIANLGLGPGREYWEITDQRLKAAGVTPKQVQAAWMKQADGMPTATQFPDYAVALEDEMLQIAQIVKERYPNLKLLYLSGRIYGGYATTPLNPEPYAYESGFSVKWLVEKQLDGDPALNYDLARGAVKAPWLAWGPYLWADGMKARSDGLIYESTDLTESDGTHPSPSGQQKVAKQLLQFFTTDSTAKSWFLRPTE